MSRTSTRQVRSASRASAARSAARRRSRKPKPRRGWLRRRGHRRGRKRGGRRRLVWLGLTMVVGLAVGYGIANRDELEETILEVTLPLRHEDIIRQQAEEKDVPADLIAAVIYVESRFRDQTSDAGARGLMQITHPTADEIEKLSGGENFEYDDLADPDLNIRYGTFYLRHLLNLYDGNEVATIAAYNAGPGTVEGWGGGSLDTDDIQFDETRDYVDNVQEKREDYRDRYGDELGLD